MTLNPGMEMDARASVAGVAAAWILQNLDKDAPPDWNI
jgi:hypothetical protein